MRCEDLTRELASPTGALSPAEMAGHLAVCPACALWSSQAARFDQIWEATRPVEPSPEQLDALWARAAVALEARSTASPLSLEGMTVPSRRRWIKPARIFAQAAAVVIAAGLLVNAIRNEAVKPQPLVGKILEAPGPAPESVQVATNPPVDASNAFDLGTLNVNVGEMAVVSIPADKNDTHKVVFLEEASSDQSNTIPPTNTHDAFNEMEVAGFRWAGR